MEDIVASGSALQPDGSSRGGLRADAQRNRDRILAAAAEVFARLGPDVALEEIAEAAGVAVGTFYRRFANRAELTRAVGLTSLAGALAEMQAAAAVAPTAWDALARILCDSQQLRLSLRLALDSPAGREMLDDDPEAEALERAMMTVLDDVVRAAHAEGSLRPDVGTGDIAMLFVMLMREISIPRIEANPLTVERSVAIMLDALHRSPGAPLPGRPILRDDLGL
jgi:AcrR family transcriptional regulator